jgi:hypothetical protein
MDTHDLADQIIARLAASQVHVPQYQIEDYENPSDLHEVDDRLVPIQLFPEYRHDTSAETLVYLSLRVNGCAETVNLTVANDASGCIVHWDGGIIYRGKPDVPRIVDSILYDSIQPWVVTKAGAAMRIASRNIEVVESFVLDASPNPHLKAQNLYMVGPMDHLYLYSYQTPIAVRKPIGNDLWEIHLNPAKYSTTTSRIQNEIRRVCDSGQVNLIEDAEVANVAKTRNIARAVAARYLKGV